MWLPDDAYPVSRGWQITVTPAAPDATALSLRWPDRAGQGRRAELAVPLAGDGTSPAAADLERLEQVASAFGRVAAATGVALDLASVDIPAWDGFAAHQPARAPQVAVEGEPPVGDERQALFRALAHELFALDSVAEVTLVLPGGEMRLQRERYLELRWDALTPAEVDRETGFSG